MAGMKKKPAMAKAPAVKAGIGGKKGVNPFVDAKGMPPKKAGKGKKK